MLHFLYSQNGHFGRELFAVFWVNVVDEDFTRRRGRRLKRVENRRPKNVVDSLSFVNVVDEDFTRRRGRRLKRVENRRPQNVVDSFVNVANVDPCTESSCSSSEPDPLAMDESSCYDFGEVEDNTAAELPHSDSTSALDTDSTTDASTSAMNKCTMELLMEAGEDSTVAAPIDQCAESSCNSSESLEESTDTLAVDDSTFYGFRDEDCPDPKLLLIGNEYVVEEAAIAAADGAAIAADDRSSCYRKLRICNEDERINQLVEDAEAAAELLVVESQSVSAMEKLAKAVLNMNYNRERSPSPVKRCLRSSGRKEAAAELQYSATVNSTDPASMDTAIDNSADSSNADSMDTTTSYMDSGTVEVEDAAAAVTNGDHPCDLCEYESVSSAAYMKHVEDDHNAIEYQYLTNSNRYNLEWKKEKVSDERT
jgi:hypothetical protein